MSGKGWTIGGETFRTTQELVDRIVTLDEGNGVLIDRIRELEAALLQARNAMWDMHSGWRYIRQHHGDLPGVGWDRCDMDMEAARLAVDRATALMP